MRGANGDEAIQFRADILDCFVTPFLAMMANKRNGTLYVGVTSDLVRRAHEHRTGSAPGFTKRYGCKLLVWYERHDHMSDAIGREKQVKAGSRRKKLELIEAANPQWLDLYESLL